MNAEQLVKKLTERYGDRVVVRSQYHIQVTSDKGNHDVWINKHGYIKFKRAGDRNVHEDIELSGIYRHIDRTGSTHIEKMQEMLDITKTIESAQHAAKTIGNGVFTDAGWKEGKAKIAAIVIEGENIDAKVRVVSTKDINEAELYAIELGLSMNNQLTIYNDNKGVCEKHEDSRVQWLSRKHIKAVDKLGNMRK